MKDRTMPENKLTARLWRGSIFAALVSSIAIFMVMLQMEKNALADYEVGDIYVACREIPKGQVIDGTNRKEFLEIKQMDLDLIPDTAIVKLSEGETLVATGKIDKDSFLTRGMFTTKEEITEGMQEPVIAGFKAEDLYQVAGGTLRSGDKIHIYQVDEEGQTRLIWEDIYVQQVFDNAGARIDCEDTTSAAQRINIYLDKAYVEHFYEQLAKGTLRVVKAVG